MLGDADVNKLFVFKSLLTTPSNVLPLHLKQTFPPIIWIFTEGDGDGIESRLPFKIFSTLPQIKQHLNSEQLSIPFNKLPSWEWLGTRKSPTFVSVMWHCNRSSPGPEKISFLLVYYAKSAVFLIRIKIGIISEFMR